MKSWRWIYHGFHGRTKMNFNAPEIGEFSSVIVTAAEVRPEGNNPNHRFLGDANVWVSNISPHGPPYDPNNGVEFVLNVDWDDPLNIAVDITLLAPHVVPSN